MPRALGVSLLVLAVLVLPGCGSDPSPGDAEPRRTLDSRAEAVRFFGAGTRALVLLRSDMPRPAADVESVVGAYPGMADLVAEAQELLAGAGIAPHALLRLGRNEEGEGPGTELAAGFAPAPSGPRLLLVMPTDRPEDLERLLVDASADGRIVPAGEYDDASLYRADNGALASRDGVLVAATGMPELRRALAVRDGDAARQVDDGKVAAILDEVPTRAPVHIVLRRGERFAALALRPDGDEVEVRVAADIAEETVESDAGPHRATVESGDLTHLAGEIGLPQPVTRGLVGLAPLRGASYANGDSFIATFTVEAR
jgi:hypothetical protein